MADQETLEPLAEDSFQDYINSVQNFSLKHFAGKVMDGKVIPVVGPGVYEIKIKDKRVKLYDYLANYLECLISVGLDAIRQLSVQGSDYHGIDLNDYQDLFDRFDLGDFTEGDEGLHLFIDFIEEKYINKSVAEKVLDDLRIKKIIDKHNSLTEVRKLDPHRFQKLFPILDRLLALRDDGEYTKALPILESRLFRLNVELTDELQLLLRMKGFNIFYLVTCDGLLERFARFYRNKTTFIPIDGEFDENYADLEKKNIFVQVFGGLLDDRAGITEKYLVSHAEKLFDKIKSANHPSEFGYEIRQKGYSVLFIGCDFDDWFTRFTLHYFSRPTDNQALYGNIYFLQETNGLSKRHRFSLIDYLDQNGTHLFLTEDSGEFYRQLVDKLSKERIKEGSQYKRDRDGRYITYQPLIDTEEYPLKVFICFEGSDRGFAQSLYDALKAEDISCFLDSKVFEPGDDIDNIIMTAIDRCQVFLPIISENAKFDSEGELNSKYHGKEWLKVLLDNASDEKKNKKIIPIKIDDHKFEYDPFKGYYWSELDVLSDLESDAPDFRLLVEKIKSIG